MKLTRLDRLARCGYFARSAVYALLGYIALSTSSLVRKGPEGEFQLLRSIPGGRIILLVLAAGLFAYSLYKILGALLDIDRTGRDARGMLRRVVFAGGGMAYVALGWLALKISVGWGSSGAANGQREAAAAVLRLPMGTAALAIVGCGFFLAAAVQLRSAITKRFMRKLRHDAPLFTCTIGRIGLTARAIVFALIGWSIFRGAWQKDEREIQDLGGTLASLHDNALLYLAVAIGLLVFAGYSGIEARYRIVPPVDPVKEGKRMAADAT